jgi:hypothetical protein
VLSNQALRGKFEGFKILPKFKILDWILKSVPISSGVVRCIVPGINPDIPYKRYQ